MHIRNAEHSSVAELGAELLKQDIIMTVADWMSRLVFDDDMKFWTGDARGG